VVYIIYEAPGTRLGIKKGASGSSRYIRLGILDGDEKWGKLYWVNSGGCQRESA